MIKSTVAKTVFNNILDAMSGVKDLRSQRGKRPIKSISQAVNAYTLVFPSITSRAVSPEASSLVAKVLESKDHQMLQMLFAANQLTNTYDDLESFLSKFHSNIEVNAINADNVLGVVNKIVREQESMGIVKKVVISEAECLQLLKEDAQNHNFVLDESISDKSISESFSVSPFDKVLHEAPIRVSGKQLERMSRLGKVAAGNRGADEADPYAKLYAANRNNMEIDKSARDVERFEWDRQRSKRDEARFAWDRQKALRDADKHILDRQKYQRDKEKLDLDRDRYGLDKQKAERDVDRLELDKQRAQRDADKFELDKQKALRDADKLELDKQKALRDADKFELDKQKAERDAEKLELDKQRAQRDIDRDARMAAQDFAQTQRMAIQNQLMNADVKKTNDYIATPLVVTIQVIKDGVHVPLSFVIGVKVKVYPVESKDIINRLVNKNKDNNFFNKILRATTSELSWSRDLMFGVDKARMDAIDAKKKSTSKLWKVLERRSTRSKFNRVAMSKNNAMAISTLVVTQEEVELLRTQFRTDLENESVARGILESYNLMCIVIVDETNEVAKFLYDTGSDSYEPVSFNVLEKQGNNNDAKKMINLMSKMR